ncbi:MAG TPA: NAD-dependent epimerase/dehydratase family protein [bacterium]|nr:NAD-dependent epimerase/dehydratase family protein [bacterium]
MAEKRISKVLVTGSSGTIGTRLCERLMAETDCTVAGIDRRPNAWNPAVQAVTVVADLLDPAAFAELPTDFDVVIHLAANARVHDVVVDPDQARDNILTIYNVLEFCRRNAIPRVMFASSREVYGNADGLVHAEQPVHLDTCESPYAASKMAGEALVTSYQRCYGLDFVNIRFSNVYGMYDDSNRVVPLFIRLTKQGQDLTVFGKDKLLDFTYIDDAVHGVMQVLERFERARNQVYNLAFGAGTTILEVAETLRDRLGAKTQIHLGDVRAGEVVQYVADITKAREMLQYAPQVPFKEGIERTVQWYEAHLYP